MAERLRGKVKFFIMAKGWGFLTPDDGGDDVFVHRNDLPEGVGSIEADHPVSFRLVETNKGNRRRASHVQLD